MLDAAAQKLRSAGAAAPYLVPTPGGQRRVLLERILYVERVGRSMRYVCEDATVDSQSIRASFREMAAPLLADSSVLPVRRQLCVQPGACGRRERAKRPAGQRRHGAPAPHGGHGL